jgi:hypothetical protein
MLKDWFYWLHQRGWMSAATQQSCRKLKEIFDRRGDEDQGGNSVATRLISDFTWYDPIQGTPPGRQAEFFIVEKDINMLKGVVSCSRSYSLGACTELTGWADNERQPSGNTNQ